MFPYGPFGNQFPYTDFHGMNLDWIIKIAKDFLDQYTHIQEIIETGEADINSEINEGLQSLSDKATELQGLLDAWYTEHSEDIASQLTSALAQMTATLGTLETAFTTFANGKATEAAESIPDDYSELSYTVESTLYTLSNAIGLLVPVFEIGAIVSSTGLDTPSTTRIRPKGYLPNGCEFTVLSPVKFLSVYYNSNYERVAAGQSWISKSAGEKYTPYNANATYVRTMIAYQDDATINNVLAITKNLIITKTPEAAVNYYGFQGDMEDREATTFVELTDLGYYSFKMTYLENITDKPDDLIYGGIVSVQPSAASNVVFQTITDSSGNQWFRWGSNSFVKTTDLSPNTNYNGSMASLGYTRFQECLDEGYYSFSQSYIPNILDRPNNLQYGGIIQVYPNSAGGVRIRILTSVGGEQWLQWSDKNWIQISFPYGTVTRNVTWYALGDSLTQGYTGVNGEIGPVTSNNYVTNLAQLNGYTFTNYGEGGAGYVHNATVGSHLNARDKADSIDFTGADLVTLAYGVNDWHYGESIGTVNDDPLSDNTMCANMKYVINKILNDNPLCKIIVLTPLNCTKYGGTFATNWAMGHSLPGSGTLKNVTDAIISVCEYYGIEYIDQSKTSVCNRINIENCLGDGIHPAAPFYPVMAKDLASKINMK